MQPLHRRKFLTTAAAGIGGASLAGRAMLANAADAGGLRLARFRFDVTPPLGHSLCGGWIKPVVGVDDPLEAIGLVLLGSGKPIVVCAVDWTGILNSAHVAWREALARAAGTTPDRVAVHCVHQHNAPFACLDAEEIVLAQGDLPHIVERDFFEACLKAADGAVRAALPHARPVTHVAHGEARVEQVAGNRRVMKSPEGKVLRMRGSSCKDPELRALPEGLIDPNLKTVVFYDGERKLAACHYYACHPMSYYGDGRVSADFCGLARRQREADEPDCFHLYFNGCGGNIGAGKYNDGSPEMRPVLQARMYDAMVRSEKNLRRSKIEAVDWRTHEILPAPDAHWDAGAIAGQIAKKENSLAGRNRPSYTLAYLRRYERGLPIVLSSLHVNDVALLHLPAESFVEYQLRAQQHAPDRFVACAAYGDGGPWYIPTADSYPEGGYEVSVAWCSPDVDQTMTRGIEKLLT